MNKPLLILLYSTAALLVAGCGKNDAGESAAQKPVAVNVIRVARAEVPRLCEVPGTVAPRDQSLVSARVMGTIAVADFAIGQGVKRGQLLVVLSAPEMAARVDQAQASLDKAKRDYERESGLLASGASTEQTVRDLAERLRIAEASLVEAQSLNAYTRIAAPFDGRITRKMANVGDFAAPGTALFEIAGNSGLRVVASAPESFPELEIGTALTLRSDGRDYNGVLAESSPAADPESRTRLVKVDLKEGSDLRSGQFVRVMWPVGSLTEILVPQSAVSRFGQIQRVYVTGGGRAHLRIVRTGEAHGDKVQILSGLSDGDEVIVNPPVGIENGLNVEVRQ